MAGRRTTSPTVSDPYSRDLSDNPGHGTGTIGILAGRRLEGMMLPEQNTRDFLGGAPHADIVPVRIADSVILLRTSAFVRGTVCGISLLT